MNNVKHEYILAKAQSQPTHFDNEGEVESAVEGGDTSAVEGAGEGAGVENATFTQTQVNSMLADNKRELKVKYATANAALLKERKAGNASKAELDDLQTAMDLLKDTFASDAEIAKRNSDKSNRANAKALKDAQASAKGWKTKHFESLISGALTQAAVANEAYVPAQVVGLFQKDAEVVDVDGVLSVLIAVDSKDSEGKDVKLKLAPTDAIAEIAKQEGFFNLFKRKGVEGLNLRPAAPLGARKMSFAEYEKAGGIAGMPDET